MFEELLKDRIPTLAFYRAYNFPLMGSTNQLITFPITDLRSCYDIGGAL